MPIIKSAVNPEAKHAGTASAHVQLDFGLCRFCEALGEHINMAAQQATRHGRENYVDMLLDLFNVFLATDSKINSLICTTCAQRLHDARDFKKLVLHAQSGFRLAATTEDQDTPTNPNTLKIKQEPQDEPEDPEPKDLEPKDLESKDLEPKNLEPQNLEPKDLEPENLEPKELEPDPQNLSEFVVKREPDIEIVEHEITQTDYNSGEEESPETPGDGEPEPKKQRLENNEPSKADSFLTELVANYTRDTTEEKTQNEPKKQRLLENNEDSNTDSFLAELLSNYTQDTTEKETQNDQNTSTRGLESFDKLFRDSYFKSVPHVEEDNNLDSVFEVPERDMMDMDEATVFFKTGCGCRLSCLDKFERNHVLKARLDCGEQNYYCHDHMNHLELILLGALSASTRIGLSDKAREMQPKLHAPYWFRGTPVCKKFFLFVYGGLTSQKCDKILKTFRERGVEALRKHSKVPLMTRQQKADVIAFINNFSEQNSLVLPGRSPDKTDLHILPSSVTRTSLYERYVRASRLKNTYPATRPLWYKCWDNFCPNVVISQPANPCGTCENFVSVLSESQAEDDKKECLRDALNHLNDVQMQRSYYQSVIAQVTPSIMKNNLSLGGNPPCSYEGSAHYSFDYIQQIHIPHNPDQIGPQDFLDKYKVSLFGVAIEPLNKFILYVIPECVPKGIALIISLLHHFFEHCALGETHVVCHSTNLCKDMTLIQYAAWRVLSGLHKSFQLSFLPSEHSKFAPDVYFGMFKMMFRESNAFCLSHVCEIAENSLGFRSITSIIVANETGDSFVNNYDWRDFFKTLQILVPPSGDLLTHSHFKADSQNPFSVMCSKSSPNHFSDPVKIFDIQSDLEMPKIIEPTQLSFARQKYLYENIRQYVSPEFQDRLCPVPNGVAESTVETTKDSTDKSYQINSPITSSDNETKQTKKRNPRPNETKQGVNSCPKRQLDNTDSKAAKKCALCTPNGSDVDSKLKEITEKCVNCNTASQSVTDFLCTLDTKDDKVESGGITKRVHVCSYCGLPGHMNIVRHGIYFCKKRRDDIEAAANE